MSLLSTSLLGVYGKMLRASAVQPRAILKEKVIQIVHVDYVQ